MRYVDQYLTRCKQCGMQTTKQHARKHQGHCRYCVAGPARPRHAAPTRQERILEHGWQAYAIEEGHYDQGDR